MIYGAGFLSLTGAQAQLMVYVIVLSSLFSIFYFTSMCAVFGPVPLTPETPETPESQNLKHETQNTNPETQNSKNESRIPNPESRILKLESRISNLEPRTPELES